MDDDFIKKFQQNFIVKNNDECWNWTGWIGTNGRAQFKYKNKIYSGSRSMYELHYKKKPGKKYVLHTCDNIVCVNPYHLWLGTQKDNVRDMYAKGREVHPPRPRKLDEQKVRQIKMLLNAGLTLTAIANQFGCTFKNISKIKCGNAWKNVYVDADDTSQKHVDIN